MFAPSQRFRKGVFNTYNLKFLQECNVAFATHGVNKSEVCPNKDEVKKIKAEGKLYSYFCEKHRH
jgi:hypothetical protein